MKDPMLLAYVKQCLVPTLERCDIVVMDNLPVHIFASSRFREAVERFRIRHQDAIAGRLIGRPRCE
jgi:hypothetical protein